MAQRCAWVDSAAATAYACPAWVWDKTRSSAADLLAAHCLLPRVPAAPRTWRCAGDFDQPERRRLAFLRGLADRTVLVVGDPELVGVLRLLEGGGFGL